MELRVKVLICLLPVFLVCPAWAGQNQPRDSSLYWEKIRRAADRIYSGPNVDLSFNTGIRRDDSRAEPYTEIEMKIPFFSASERQKMKESKLAFLEKAAGVLQKMDKARAELEVLEEKRSVLKQTLIQSGAKGIDQYFQLRQKQCQLRAKIRQCRRHLNSMIEMGK